MTFGSIFELLKALKAALIARLEVSSLLSAICLCLIPVREYIHSSDVSTIFFKSSFEYIFFGRKCPKPDILV